MSTLVRSSSSDMLHSGRWRETAAGRDESISDRAAATSVSGSTRPRPGTRASTLNFRKAVSQDIRNAGTLVGRRANTGIDMCFGIGSLVAVASVRKQYCLCGCADASRTAIQAQRHGCAVTPNPIPTRHHELW